MIINSIIQKDGNQMSVLLMNLIRLLILLKKKFQNSNGSVDEKLPGCHFKKNGV